MDLQEQQALAAQGQGQIAPSPVGNLIVTDFAARGWDPTHPDEQLVGSSGAPGAQFGIAAGAPFASPDVHDVDFWNGYLNKRNGKIALAGPLAAAPVLGLFNYVFANAVGVLTKALIALCDTAFYVYNGSTWVENLHTVWSSAQFAYFTTLQNLLFISGVNPSGYSPLFPLTWDGASSYFGYHAPRMSPSYLLYYGGDYSGAQISSISGESITMDSDQPASGLYVGKQIWLLNQADFMEPATIASFVASGTPGSSTYYVTSILLVNPPRYPTGGYAYVTWNGATVAGLTTGGSITTSGNLTTIKILAVTNFISGGQRASESSVDLAAGTTGSITISNLKMNYGDGDLFGTDIANLATTWYMTAPFNPQLPATDPNSGPSQIYYLIPDNQGTPTDTSLGYNPMPNSTTGFTILTPRNTASDTTLVGNTGVDAQGYFTGQVDVPFYQFSVAWENFLVCAGDIWHPSWLWISAFGAPQVFGTQGSLDGTYIEVPNGNDGQVIVALYVWRGDLYIFKTNSVYVLQFTGNTSLTPFNLTKLQGYFGAVSPKAIAESDTYLLFLTPSGVAAISGLTVALLPENEMIRSKLIGPNSWNMGVLSTAQAISFPTKKQIWFQVAEKTVGDTVLVYDWSRRNFWYDTAGVQESSLFQDLSSAPPVPYGGDSAGQVWILDYPGADEEIPIDFSYSTPWLNLGDPASFKQLRWLWVAGVIQQAGLLNIEIFLDFQNKVWRVIQVDMTQQNFGIGLAFALGINCKYVKLVLQNNTAAQPVSIRFLKMQYENLGARL